MEIMTWFLLAIPNTFSWFQNDGLDDSGVPILTRYLIESNSTGGWSFTTGDMDNNGSIDSSHGI